VTTSRDHEIRQCFAQLRSASALLDAGNLSAARAMTALVRSELERLTGDELMASLSLAFMFLEELEGRLP
jgi:hypothetical protein